MLVKPRTMRTSAEAARLRADERVTALSIMYQAERQDRASNILAGLTLIAAALAYLGVAALLLGDDKLPGGSWTQALLAFPLWVAVSFQVLLVWSALTISRSVQAIEIRLWDSLGASGEESWSARREFGGQPRIIKIQSFICYGGVWVVVVAFSVVCLAVAAKRTSWVSAQTIISAVFYALLLSGNILAWRHISKHSSSRGGAGAT